MEISIAKWGKLFQKHKIPFFSFYISCGWWGGIGFYASHLSIRICLGFIAICFIRVDLDYTVAHIVRENNKLRKELEEMNNG